MALPQGINFRQSATFVTDNVGAGEDWQVTGGESAFFVTAPTYPEMTTQGNNVGWELVSGSVDIAVRNDNSGVDRRLAGVNSVSADQAAYFRIDLPAPGDYLIRLAAGRYNYAQATRVELFDNTTSLGVLCSGATGAAGSFRDATNALLTAANWITSNAAVTKTFASTICRFKVGEASAADAIAHVYIESAGPTTLTTGLVSYWELGEASGTRSDSHGTNHLTDNNTVAQAGGKVGNCASFVSANSEYLSIADNASLSLGDIDFTYCAWVQLADKSDFRTMCSKGASGSGATYFQYTPVTDDFKLHVYSGASFAGGDLVRATTLGSPALNTWYFVVAWYDATADTLSIQVNDGTVNSVAHTAGAFDDTGPFAIGMGYTNSEFMDGLIDQVGFWKRVLTAPERTTLYNSGAGLSYAQVVAGGPTNWGRLLSREINRLVRPIHD